ncbi:MAG: YggT family protein [Microbacteriaceae bacterium]
MAIVSVLAHIAYYLLLIFFFVMWARFIVDLVRSFSRGWRPKGFALVVTEGMYIVTDPPIRFFRKLIPPLSIGPVAIDFGWSLTMLVCVIGMYISTFFTVS